MGRRGLVCAVVAACSPAGEPAVRVPSSPPPVHVEVAAPVIAAAREEAVREAPVVRDCLAEPAISEVAAPTWQLVGTTDEPAHLHAMGSVVFLSTERRLYEATAGEPLVASTTRAAGLPGRKRVVRMLGTWPDDAWLATFEGEMTRGGGGAKFHLWRWSVDRWVRLTRAVVYGDGAPEFYKGTDGRALALRCGSRPALELLEFGGAGAAGPRALERAPHSSFCPQVFMATPSGELLAVDEVRSDPPSVQVSGRCAGCEAATITALKIPRMCDEGPTWSVWGMRAATPTGDDVVLGLHTSVVLGDGSGRQSGTFLLRRAGAEWAAEAVPGGVAGGTIDAMVRAADGSLWLVTERLLRRAADGAWTQVALPEALRGPEVRVDLRGVATLGEEVWLLAETIREGEAVWSVFRAGPVAVAAGPGVGRPL